MLSDEEIRALPADDRACLLQQLNALAGAESTTSPTRTGEDARRRFLVLMTGCAVVLLPWIVFLGITLPPRYVTTRWGATWVGFDVALIAGLGATAWLSWRRYQAVVVAALITGTLLVTDAWFDIMTSSSRTDLVVSVASALLVELPLAGLLFLVGYRLLGVAVRRAQAVTSQPADDLPRWNTPLLGVPPRPNQRTNPSRRA